MKLINKTIVTFGFVLIVIGIIISLLSILLDKLIYIGLCAIGIGFIILIMYLIFDFIYDIWNEDN